MTLDFVDMSGNVTEWCADAWGRISMLLGRDNPTYLYDAKEDPPALKRKKLIRGGSRKDTFHLARYQHVPTNTRIHPSATSVSVVYRTSWDVRRMTIHHALQEFTINTGIFTASLNKSQTINQPTNRKISKSWV
ncbi:MAG: SUMF1/EgtB/PvdO family nonheme iron enzyme [Bacteroidales bacterium]|nr:SUMF1/EgtB/PvdO family nonheme iron enzyme [Bacteroidales bacterium]